MATMRLERARTLVWLGLLSLVVQGTNAWSQSPTTSVQPTLDTQVLATNNATGSSTAPKSDVLLTVSPGMKISTKGANSEIEGSWSFTHVHFIHQTQSDRILPIGAVNAHLGKNANGLTLDAGVAAAQSRSQFTAANSTTPATQDTYTDYRYRLSPKFARQIDSSTSLLASLERTWLNSERNNDTLTNRPNSRTRNDGFSILRQPTPFGFGLDGAYQSTMITSESAPTLAIQSVRGRLVYALTRELEIGAIAGKETTRVLLRSTSDNLHGAQLHWTPTERSVLKGFGEHHMYGETWQVDASHRSPWFNVGLQSRRTAETSAASLGTFGQGLSIRDVLDAILSTRITDKADRSRSVDNIITQRNLPTNLTSTRDLYDLSAQIRHVTIGQMSFMGRRDLLILAGGLSKSRPLRYAPSAEANPLLPDVTSGEYFADAQLTHQLTRHSSITGGLRWSKAHNTTSLNGSSYISHSRDFSWRASLSDRLTPNATAIYGVRRQITHLDNTTTSESVVFAGIGYRF